MTCPFCGSNQPDTAKFCSNCGNRIVSTEPQTANTSAPQVGLPNKGAYDSRTGVSSGVNESSEPSKPFPSERRAEYSDSHSVSGSYDSRTDTFSELSEPTNSPKQPLHTEQPKTNPVSSPEPEKKSSAFVIFTAVTLVIFAGALLLALTENSILCMVIAGLQIAASVVALLIHKHVIKAPAWARVIPLLAAIVLAVPFVNAFPRDIMPEIKTAPPIEQTEETQPTLDWSEIVLGESLPTPPSESGEIHSNSDQSFWVDVTNISSKQYYAYVDECIKKGFTTESEKSTFSYAAYDSAGNKLRLSYYESSKELSIRFDKPESFASLKWPTEGLGAMVPAPAVFAGRIDEDTTEKFSATVSGLPADQFESYVQQCKSSGYDQSPETSEKQFSAKNKAGYALTLSYIGNGVVEITLEEPVFDITLKVECVENLFFSTYDVKITVDDDTEETLSHGKTETYSLALKKGEHQIQFAAASGSDAEGEYRFHCVKNGTVALKIYCFSSEVNVNVLSNTAEPVTEPPSERLTTTTTTAISSTTKVATTEKAGISKTEPKTTKKQNKETTTVQTVSIGKQNAVRKAESYLSFSAFSYKGLIEQLEYEGFTHEEAVYGADHCNANWKEQALKKANSYLSISGFSKKGLIEQLEYEKFTHEQATYAVDHCGANWNEQAAKKAKSYMELSSFPKNQLIEQLEYEGFTHEQAVYGANTVF